MTKKIKDKKRMESKANLSYKDQKFKKLGDVKSKSFKKPLGKPELKSKPSRAMMMDTTTGMGANIFMIPKKKPNKKKSGTNKNKKKN